MYKSVVNAYILAKLRHMFIRILFLETALFFRSVRCVCNNARIEETCYTIKILSRPIEVRRERVSN